MKPKLLVIVAILVTLAVVTPRSRASFELAPRAPRSAAKAVLPDVKAGASPFNVKEHPALASHRVFEEPVAKGVLPYRGANYRAEVSSDGLLFEADGYRMSLRARRLEQGDASLDLGAGPATQARWAAADVERGSGVTEQFIFENRRAEHIVRVDRPIGEGALKVRVAVETNLGGQVQQVGRHDSAWKDTAVEDGGLVFHDVAGRAGLSYHGAVAIDAKGRRQPFDPRWEGGEIALEVPASFMKDAAYPVLIDPWLELNFSGSGGGITNTGTVSEAPAISLIGFSSPCVAWSDASDGDFDIYFRYWTGFEWEVLGPANANVSANTGRSTNPSIGFYDDGDSGQFDHPYIAWEDDQSGTVNIYARFWNGTTWAPKAGSTTSSGVSLVIGTPVKNPQACFTFGFINNNNGTIGRIPVIVYEIDGVGIRSRWLYTGDTSFPEGWYHNPSPMTALGQIGIVSDQPSASRPSARSTATGQVIVAYEQSSGTQMDIFVSTNPNTFYTLDGSGFPVGFFGGGVSNNSPWVQQNVCAGLPVALSVQASLALDPTGNAYVAWQESVGAEREIYVRRSLGGAAFAGFGSSDTGGGVSRTGTLGTSNSSFPSIAISPVTPVASNVRPVVAWEEDASGNTEINVRRLNAAGTAWDQIADEGSAFLVAGDTASNSGGVSRTPNFSLQPRATVAPDGTITVAWRDGTAGTFDLLARRYHDNSPTSLSQGTMVSGVLTPLAIGGTTTSVDVVFTGIPIAESAAIAPLRLQLEIKPSTTPFTGTPTHDSNEVATGVTATVNFTGLPNVNYHWRVRSIDSLGRSSPWTSFGGNTDGQIDFRIDSTATGAGSSNNILGTGPSEHKDKCGLVGLEAFALIALAAFARRRRMSNA
jgi:hypothetical protein